MMSEPCVAVSLNQTYCQGKETDVKSIYCTHYIQQPGVPPDYTVTSVELLMSGYGATAGRTLVILNRDFKFLKYPKLISII